MILTNISLESIPRARLCYAYSSPSRRVPILGPSGRRNPVASSLCRRSCLRRAAASLRPSTRGCSSDRRGAIRPIHGLGGERAKPRAAGSADVRRVRSTDAALMLFFSFNGWQHEFTTMTQMEWVPCCDTSSRVATSICISNGVWELSGEAQV